MATIREEFAEEVPLNSYIQCFYNVSGIMRETIYPVIMASTF